MLVKKCTEFKKHILISYSADVSKITSFYRNYFSNKRLKILKFATGVSAWFILLIMNMKNITISKSIILIGNQHENLNMFRLYSVS